MDLDCEEFDVVDVFDVVVVAIDFDAVAGDVERHSVGGLRWQRKGCDFDGRQHWPDSGSGFDRYSGIWH